MLYIEYNAIVYCRTNIKTFLYNIIYTLDNILSHYCCMLYTETTLFANLNCYAISDDNDSTHLISRSHELL